MGAPLLLEKFFGIAQRAATLCYDIAPLKKNTPESSTRMEHSSWLSSSLIYLAAAVFAVPISKALGLGSIIGYLAAGFAIGPWGMGLVQDAQSILHFAEFGVVLMLFLVGLELEPKRLWQLRRPIFGWGSLQVLSCFAIIFIASYVLFTPGEGQKALINTWQGRTVMALGLALSSTAIALQVMNERNLLPTPAGQAGFSILLFQDVAAIPILALLPLLAVGGAASSASDGSAWLEAGKALGAIVIIIFGGRLVVRPLLRWIARSRTPEIFTAAALLLVVAIAALMQAVGLSMALGAFLAGVLLAESEYRRELETDIEPFKGLLLGLFFIAVGMSVDCGVILANPLLVAVLTLGFMALKALAIFSMARVMGLSFQERPVFTLLLAQGGEFAFVVFQAAAGAKAISGDAASLLNGVVALSMLLSPLILVLIDRFLLPRYANCGLPEVKEIDEPQSASTIIAGFGRYGQIIGRVLIASGHPVTVLDHDPVQIEGVRRFGFRIFYGNATRLDLLRTAGAAQAKLLVVAIDDIEQSLALVQMAKDHFPQLQIVARARNVQHYYQLRAKGVTMIERETFESALLSGRSALQVLGHSESDANATTDKFRTHNLAQIESMWPHHKDQERLLAMAKAGRQQLEEMLSQERAAGATLGTLTEPGSASKH
jgi:glutathione-regulated potassium-efflux system ancillary protein KefC